MLLKDPPQHMTTICTVEGELQCCSVQRVTCSIRDELHGQGCTAADLFRVQITWTGGGT